MTDEPERFTGSRLPADLVHLWGTDGYDQRLKRGADWETDHGPRVKWPGYANNPARMSQTPYVPLVALYWTRKGYL
jgi:hypothetical protein